MSHPPRGVLRWSLETAVLGTARATGRPDPSSVEPPLSVAKLNGGSPEHPFGLWSLPPTTPMRR